MTPLLLVEDEVSIARPLAAYLRDEGYRVTVAMSVREARTHVDDAALVLLDWRLPDGNGLELLRSWRAAGQRVPVILLTARDELIDRVVGLESGADDYVTKPFEPRELLARIRVRLRTSPPENTHTAGPFRIDEARRTATFEGTPLSLTRKEFDLLRFLVQRRGRVATRGEILREVWGLRATTSTRTVDTHILQLRSKTRATLFETVRGLGYRFVSPDLTQT